MSAHLRIEQHGAVAIDTKVIHVAEDGTETDISACISHVTLNMRVGEAVTATLKGFVGEALVSDVRADRVLVDLDNVRPSRVPWLRRLRDVTTFGAPYRLKMRA